MRAIPFVAALAVVLSATAFAQPPAQPLLDDNILRGIGPDTIAPAQKRPYFPGWSIQVTPRSEQVSDMLKFPKEPGGLAVDPVSGWVYVGTRDGRLVCVNGGGNAWPKVGFNDSPVLSPSADTGSVVWSVDIGGQLLAPPHVFKDSVVAATAEGVLYILNKVTGARNARAILGEELITEPVIAEDAPGHARIYVGSSAESLFAVNLDDGTKAWRVHRDPPSGFTVYGFARPIVTPSAIYASFADGVVESLEPSNGAVIWEKHISPPGDMLDVDALAYNNVSLFAASYSGGVFAMDPVTGDIRWQQKISHVTRLLTDGLSVYTSGPGVWTGMRADDGFILWRFGFGDGRTSTRAAQTDRVLVFAPEDGSLLFVDKRTGQGLGAFPDGDGFSTPPVLAGPVLYALSNFGRVYSAVVVP